MLRFYTCILLLLTCSISFSQKTTKQKIDSLEVIIRTSKNDSILADTYSELSFVYIGFDSVKAYNAVNKAIEIAQKNKDIYNLGKAYVNRGGVNLDYNAIEAADSDYLKSKEVLKPLIEKDSSEKNLQLWLRSIYNLSVIASYKGDLKEQLEYKEKSLVLAKKLNAESILSRLYINSAIMLHNQGANDKAHGFFMKSGALLKKNKEYQTYIQDRLIFASVLGDLDSLNRMKSVIDESKYYIDKLQDSLTLHLYYMGLSQYYNLNDNYEKSISNLEKASNIAESTGVGYNKNQMYVDFINIHEKYGNHKKAKKYALSYLDFVKQNNNKLQEAESYKQLSIFEKADGNILKSLNYLENYVKIKDSINFYELTEKIGALESKYEKEKKEREILQLKSKNDSAQLQLAKKRTQNYSLLLISGSLLFLSILGYFGYVNSKRKEKLKEKEINDLKHEQEAKTYNAMLEGQENERERLAADLHDGLAGRLSATRIKLEQLSKKATSDKVELDNALHNIDDSLSELRNIARNLMPETVLKYGLKAAVEDYCTSISTGVEDIKFIIQFYDTEANIPKSTLLTLYRIIQELINNAVKHSQATEVLVQFLIENGNINITVEDNGQGFTFDKESKRGGMGLHNLKTRVAYLNGEIDFDSSVNEGTTAHIVIKI